MDEWRRGSLGRESMLIRQALPGETTQLYPLESLLLSQSRPARYSKVGQSAEKLDHGAPKLQICRCCRCKVEPNISF
ncbi:unnamed protein product [Protopolystoma xenopodis]|uniref:Uncharacterized protein n=1 Tax=Protopolystoma xenopodis TaxID=117903 RepID=A0A448X4U7_9PLAT|nr:unnamed protein product [Protopolystoma xenopodis]